LSCRVRSCGGKTSMAVWKLHSRKDAYGDSQNLIGRGPKALPTFTYRSVLNLCVLRARH
jgi:hypothetical protein